MAERVVLMDRLGVRLAFALALALLPLGILTSYQVQSLMGEAQARSEAAILGETLLAVAPEAGLIRDARAAVAALALPLSAFYRDTALCTDLMRKLVDQPDTAYSFAAFVPVSGQVVCASNGEPLDLTQSTRLAAMIANPKPDIVVIPMAVVSGTSVLAFGHPVFDADGTFVGYVSVSMPHSVLQSATRMDWMAQQVGGDEPVSIITFDSAGTVLTSTTGLDNAALDLPSDRSVLDLVSLELVTFSARSGSGDMRVYAVAPIVGGTLYTLGSWPADDVAGATALFVSPYLPPVLMWVVSLLVAIWASERLVTRHIRVLRRSITSFARGARVVGDVDLPGASAEIRDVADAYLQMTDTILHDEAELEDIVHQREVLLREVHHRVKNNLQLIASIMNMQMRQARSPETRVLMKSLQDRVMSLATIHRELYQTSGLTDVRADELLAQIVRQVLSMASGPGRRFDVVTSFDVLRLTPDQAVPLSLLLTEALTNAIKYARAADGSPPKIEVTLRRDEGTLATLELSNSLAGPSTLGVAAGRDNAGSESDGTGLGSQLLAAFAQQLGGEYGTDEVNGVYRLWITFAVAPLFGSEAGSTPDAAPDAVPDPA